MRKTKRTNTQQIQTYANIRNDAQQIRKNTQKQWYSNPWSASLRWVLGVLQTAKQHNREPWPPPYREKTNERQTPFVIEFGPGRPI